MKKICVVTSTRAEYGLLRNVIQCIEDDKDLELNLIVTGTHLSSDYGLTVKEIEQDGWPISEKIDILMNSNDSQGIAKTMGIALISFGEVFTRNKPDMLIVLGDRYELIPICSAAMVSRIPIAHISGGETTQGAIDECIRHSITKMSFLHFPGCEEYRRRIIQLGENPDRVFNFGDVGVENIQKIKCLSKKELEERIQFKLDKPYYSVTFHPVTLEDNSALNQIEELLQAIDDFDQCKFIFTYANADMGGEIINKRIEHYVNEHKNCIAFKSMGSLNYLSSLKYAEGIIGNSSSGIVEAPCFKIPTINIGNRQAGRLQANSIINVTANASEIKKAIQETMLPSNKLKYQKTNHPYAGGNTASNIVNTIKEFLKEDEINLQKEFYDVKFEVNE